MKKPAMKKADLITAIVRLTLDASQAKLRRRKVAELQEQLRELQSLPVATFAPALPIARIAPPIARVAEPTKPVRKPRSARPVLWTVIAAITLALLATFVLSPALFIGIMCGAILAAFFAGGFVVMSTGGFFSLWFASDLIRVGFQLVGLILQSAVAGR